MTLTSLLKAETIYQKRNALILFSVLVYVGRVFRNVCQPSFKIWNKQTAEIAVNS